MIELVVETRDDPDIAAEGGDGGAPVWEEIEGAGSHPGSPWVLLGDFDVIDGVSPVVGAALTLCDDRLLPKRRAAIAHRRQVFDRRGGLHQFAEDRLPGGWKFADDDLEALCLWMGRQGKFDAI